MVNEAPYLYTTELDNLTSLCFRAMDGSNYDVRCDVAKLLGRLLAATQKPSPVPHGMHLWLVMLLQVMFFMPVKLQQNPYCSCRKKVPFG